MKIKEDQTKSPYQDDLIAEFGDEVRNYPKHNVSCQKARLKRKKRK